MLDLDSQFPVLLARSVCGILTDMDAEIAALEALLAKARALKQGRMRELLAGMTRLV